MGGQSELFRLGADTLSKLDRGSAAVALDRAITQAVRDCIDRPGDDRTRKITMQIDLKPVPEMIDNTVSCEGAKGKYLVRLRLPDFESQTLDFGVRENGMLIFNENSPSNHAQTTFLGGDE